MEISGPERLGDLLKVTQLMKVSLGLVPMFLPPHSSGFLTASQQKLL